MAGLDQGLHGIHAPDGLAQLLGEGAAPGGEWLARSAPVDLGGFAAQIAAGALIAMGSILVVALVGRTVRRGIRLFDLTCVAFFAKTIWSGELRDTLIREEFELAETVKHHERGACEIWLRIEELADR